MLDQDINFYLICLSILITCLLGNVWRLLGEVSFESLLEVKGLTPKIQFKILPTYCHTFPHKLDKRM